MSQITFLGIGLSLLFATASEGWAKGPLGAGLISTAAGQTDSSQTAPMFSANQNSTGILHNFRRRVVAGAGSGNDDFSPVDYGAAFIYGAKGKFAAGVGATTRSGSGSDALLRSSIAGRVGKAVGLGVGLIYNIDQKSLDGGVSALINPSGKFRVGLNAYGFNGGLNGLGGGMAFDLNREWTLGADITTNDDFENQVVTGGITYSLRFISLGAGYAYALDDSSNAAQPVEADRFYVALGFTIADDSNFKIYYRHKNLRYFAALSIGF